MKLIFKGTPKAVQSFRFTRQGRKYQPKDVKDWKDRIKREAMAQMGEMEPFRGAVRIVRALFVFPPITSLRKADRLHIENGGYILKTTKPDLTDNLFKGLIDSLAEVVYERDQQICNVCNTIKVMGKEPRIEIEFEEIENLNLEEL